MIYFIMVFLLITISVTIFLEKKLTNPTVLFSSIWLVSIFLSSLKLYNMIDYSQKAVLLITEGIIAFILGVIISKKIFKKNVNKEAEKNEKIEIIDNKILTILATVGLIMVSILSVKVIGLLINGVDYSEIRGLYYSYGKDSLITNEKLFTIFDWSLSIILTISIPTIIIGLMNKKIKLSLVIESILMILLYVFSTAGRTPIILIAMELVIALLMNKEKINEKIKRFSKIALVCSMLFVLCMTLFRTNKSKEGVNSMYAYLSLPLPYFSKIIDKVDTQDIRTYGLATAYGPYLLVQKSVKLITGYKLGNAEDLAAIVTKPQTYWVKIFPETTDYYNAYATMFYNFYLDFRDFGIIIISLLYGILMGKVYIETEKKKTMKLNVIYLILISGLLKSFASWQFASPSIILAFVIINIIFRKKVKPKEKNSEEKAKRILVFGMTENPGGIESVLINYYRVMDKQKIQFDFLCNTEKVAYEEEIRKLGGELYKIPSRSKSIIQYYKKLKEFFEENAYKYSTIWVNICSLANIDYLIFAKKYRIKYRIIHCHNSQNMDSKLRKLIHNINRGMLKIYATDYWTCSKDANKWFFNNNIMKNNDIICINNAIDYNKFKYNEKIRIQYRNDLELNEKLVFGHIGRFHFQKNQMFLLDVFNEIQKINPNSELLLIGDGEDREKIEEKLKQLKIENNVKLLGLRDDVENVIQSMDAIIFPSLFEGLSLVLIEAQANGVPLFVSNTISQETKMGENITFISLDKSPEEWAQIILKSDFDRANNSEQIRQKGYDINVEKEKLEKLLMRN